MSRTAASSSALPGTLSYTAVSTHARRLRPDATPGRGARARGGEWPGPCENAFLQIGKRVLLVAAAMQDIGGIHRVGLVDVGPARIVQ